MIASHFLWKMKGGVTELYTDCLDRKERAMREGGRERENSTKSQGGLYNMPQYSTIPQKWPRSGVTFHYLLIQIWDSVYISMKVVKQVENYSVIIE